MNAGFFIMNNYTCTKCNTEKPKSEFHKDKTKKSGVKSWCKKCTSEKIKGCPILAERRKLFKEKNPEKYKEYKIKTYNKNRDKILLKRAIYRENKREELREKDKIYKSKNAEKIKQKSIEYSKLKSEKRKLEKQAYLESDQYKQLLIDRKLKSNERDRLRCAKKRKEYPMYRLKDNLRARTRKAFKNIGNKKHSSSELLGVSYSELYLYIESLFTEGMTWCKFGKYIHIDHIIPLASAKTEDELIKLCHYTNLQPLWAWDNIAKGDKILKTS